ncbi:hypothetical protein BLA29_000974 [Euroglyphus maynei]|uniref:Uncharacterized protein n=1 Tax=Euroglyphus maynei TaxID=6958 RepID=A0A1Y3B0A4_EURMA|nr:hypothetical protein BLA29_000974 [Euroglyphus maynei]
MKTTSNLIITSSPITVRSTTTSTPKTRGRATKRTGKKQTNSNNKQCGGMDCGYPSSRSSKKNPIISSTTDCCSKPTAPTTTTGYLLQSALSGDRSPASSTTSALINGKLNRYQQPEQHMDHKNPLSIRNSSTSSPMIDSKTDCQYRNSYYDDCNNSNNCNVENQLPPLPPAQQQQQQPIKRQMVYHQTLISSASYHLPSASSNQINQNQNVYMIHLEIIIIQIQIRQNL